MPRRRLATHPTSRLTIWARRLAIFSLPVALLAILIERAGLFEILPVLVTFGAALALAVTAVLLALAGLVVIWFDGRDGINQAITAICISMLLLGYPAYLTVKAMRLPSINDVTTDGDDPPRFEAIARLRTREANPVAYPGFIAYAQQRVAYPDVEPLNETVEPQVAYDAAMAVLAKRKWRVVDARTPQPGRRDGHIEAIARTVIMGFRDDVVIRIRATQGGGSRIDIRSASRYGWHDFGANAARILGLIDDIDDAATPDKTEAPVKKTAKTQKPAAANAPPSKR